MIMKASFHIGFLSILILSVTTAAPFRRHYIFNNEAKSRQFLKKKITTPNSQPQSERGRVHSTEFSSSILETAISLRGGGGSGAEMANDAFEWCANLGAPAALVGGAVMATLIDTREFLGPTRQDSQRIRASKQLTRFLLLSAFVLELISIFATTVTGTMLLTEGDRGSIGAEVALKSYNSPLGFLFENHTFEYLTARITFLQGLLNWLMAIALELTIPKPSEGESSRRMNAFISSSLVTIIFLMLSFYNAHMTFYDNYLGMLCAYGKAAFDRYLKHWPPRPMSILYIPSLLWTIRSGVRVFTSDPALDTD